MSELSNLRKYKLIYKKSFTFALRITHNVYIMIYNIAM